MYQKQDEKPIKQHVSDNRSDNRYSVKEKNDSKVITTVNKSNTKKFVVRYFYLKSIFRYCLYYNKISFYIITYNCLTIFHINKILMAYFFLKL